MKKKKRKIIDDRRDPLPAYRLMGQTLRRHRNVYRVVYLQRKRKIIFLKSHRFFFQFMAQGGWVKGFLKIYLRVVEHTMFGRPMV